MCGSWPDDHAAASASAAQPPRLADMGRPAVVPARAADLRRQAGPRALQPHHSGDACLAQLACARRGRLASFHKARWHFIATSPAWFPAADQRLDGHGGHGYRCARDVRLSCGGAAVSDILSQGSDREPRRRRRWQLVAVAAGIAAALTAIFVWYLPSLRQHGARPRPGAVGPSPAVQGEPGSPTATPSPLPSKPARMTGQPLPRDASLTLVLGGGQRPAWLSVATGRTEPIRGLPRSGNGYQLIRIAGGWTAQPFPAGGTSCDTCAPGPLPVYYVADGSPVASRIGAADFTAPAATGGALWLISYRRGADMSTAVGNAQEVSVTGATLGPRLKLPAGYMIDQGTRSGLLLVQEAAGSSLVRYELWDPGTRRATRSFVDLIAASPAEIAWMPGCTATCRVHVLDLPGGRVEEISLPGRSTAYDGAFSPDGRLLALLVTARVTAAGRAAATRLIVVTVASGRITAVPGTTVGSGNGVAFGWQAGSHQLIADVAMSTADQPEWQIAEWQPGDARLSTALARAPYESWPVIDQGPY